MVTGEHMVNSMCLKCIVVLLAVLCGCEAAHDAGPNSSAGAVRMVFAELSGEGGRPLTIIDARSADKLRDPHGLPDLDSLVVDQMQKLQKKSGAPSDSGDWASVCIPVALPEYVEVVIGATERPSAQSGKFSVITWSSIDCYPVNRGNR